MRSPLLLLSLPPCPCLSVSASKSLPRSHGLVKVSLVRLLTHLRRRLTVVPQSSCVDLQRRLATRRLARPSFHPSIYTVLQMSLRKLAALLARHLGLEGLATFYRWQVVALQEGREGAPSAAGKAAPIPVSAPTSTFQLAVIPANIATSIPYRQYCFAYHSSR